MENSTKEMSQLTATEAIATSRASEVTNGSGALNGVNVVSGPTSSNSCDGNITGSNNGMTNTISAAADSSDNQPGTPPTQQQQLQQPQLQQHQQTLTSLVGGNDHNQQQEQQQQQQPPITTQSYATHPNMFNSSNGGNAPLPTTSGGQQMYSANAGNIFVNASGQVMQQQHPSYGSTYMNSYEQFYQQQQQQLQQQQQSGSEYVNNGSNLYPYLQTPIAGIPSNGGNNNNINGNDIPTPSAASVNAASTVSTTSVSPRNVSSSSPTSTSHMQVTAGGSNNTSGSKTNSPGCKLQCKKCGVMAANESELQEHIANVHGESPYGSSGYAGSPFIKEELHASQPAASTVGNPGDILDLDSQKMVYPPLPGNMQQIMQHDPAVNNVMPSGPDPLHSMQSMQQRALHSWEQPAQEPVPQYMQTNQQQLNVERAPHQSPYYSPKQSPYHQSSGGMIKQEFNMIDTQDYIDKSFDPTAASGDLCQQAPAANSQQQQMMPVATSPAEFPSTTTGGPQENVQQQQYRSFEPPSSSSVLPANSLTAKAATWKSNEARRPKTYHCTACSKWFTSSGHLKRHYNTTLHKNAVKSSGQPDPATLPISAHHHPARDPIAKPARRSGGVSAAAAMAAASAVAAAKQPPAPVQPPEPPRSPPDYGGHGAAGVGGPMSQYSASPSPTAQSISQQSQTNRLSGYGQTNTGYSNQFMQQVQSTSSASPQHSSNNQQQPQTALNGHPNGLAGPSALITQMPSSQMRGLLKSPLSTTSTVSNQSVLLEDSNCSNSSSNNSPNITPQSPMVTLETAIDVQEMEQEMELQMELQQLPIFLGDLHPSQQQACVNLLRPYPNNMPNSNIPRAPSPLIICHPQYQEQIQQQQMVFSHTQQLPQLVHMGIRHNITGPPYNIIPLDTSMQQQLNNNMQQLQQQQQHITNSNSIATINMDTMLQPLSSHHRFHQTPIQDQAQTDMPVLSELLEPHHQVVLTPTASPTQQQLLPLPPMSHSSLLSSINTLTTITQPQQLQPPLITTIVQQQQPLQQRLPTITPSFHRLPTVQEVLEPIVNYHITTGKSDDTIEPPTYTAVVPTQQQLVTTSEGQVLEVMSSVYKATTTEEHESKHSPHAGDLPPSAFTDNSPPHETTETQSKTIRYTKDIDTICPAKQENILSPNNAVSPVKQIDVEENHKPTSATPDNNIESDSSGISSLEASIAIDKSPKKSSVATTKRRRSTVPTTTDSKSTAPLRGTVLPSGRVQCNDCKKEFSKNCYLTQHIKSFHYGEYPYRCLKCGKRFQVQEIYQDHVDRHSILDKPFKCIQCPKQFFHNTDLRRHTDAIHTGIKQHLCEICQKSFCRKDHLRKHIETHSRPSRKPKTTAANKKVAPKKPPLAKISA